MFIKNKLKNISAGFWIWTAFFVLPTMGLAQSVSFTSITVSNANPSPGASIGVTVVYCETGTYITPNFYLGLNPSQTTLQACPVANQILLVDKNTTPTGVSPVTSSVNETNDGGGGWAGIGWAGTPACPVTQVWVVTIPSTLSPGPYNLIAQEHDYYIGCDGNSYPNISTVVTIPLPPAAFTISKRAEGNTASPQGLVLFSIDYSFVNTNNFIITDNIPANTTFVTANAAGGVSGGSVTWNLGNASTQQSGTVWFLAQVNSGTANGTTITNTAWGQTNEVAAASSNTVSVVVGSPAVTLTKSESAASLGAGSTVTYSLAWTASGQNLDYYDSYLNDPTGTSGNSIQGYDGTAYTQVGTGTFQVGPDPTNANNNCLVTNPGSSSNFPLLLRNSPAFDICGGVIVEGDVLIPLVGPPGGADATMVLAYNFSGGVTQAYMLGISLDPGPGNFFLQKNNGSTVTDPETLNNASLGLTINRNTWYTLKGQITYSAGSLTIQGKIWQTGTAEPASWTFTYTDPSPFPCGQTWQQGWQSDGTAYSPGDDFANLKVFGPGPVINSTISDAVPSGITYLGSNSVTATSAPNLSWSFPSTLFSQALPVTWWGQAACPGPIANQFSMIASNMASAVTSNTVTLNMTSCGPTPTPTDTPTTTPSATPTSTGTLPPSATPTLTPTPTTTFSPTSTATLTDTATPTASPTITPTSPPTATFTPTPVGLTVWPNPFSTKYAVAVGPQNKPALQAYQVPLGAKMTIYTLSGELVNTLAPEPTGYIYWYGTNSSGSPVSPGIYYYVIQNGNTTLLNGKVLVLKD